MAGHTVSLHSAQAVAVAMHGEHACILNATTTTAKYMHGTSISARAFQFFFVFLLFAKPDRIVDTPLSCFFHSPIDKSRRGNKMENIYIYAIMDTLVPDGLPNAN